jgi:hypothetical protein
MKIVRILFPRLLIYLVFFGCDIFVGCVGTTKESEGHSTLKVMWWDTNRDVSQVFQGKETPIRCCCVIERIMCVACRPNRT